MAESESHPQEYFKINVEETSACLPFFFFSPGGNFLLRLSSLASALDFECVYGVGGRDYLLDLDFWRRPSPMDLGHFIDRMQDCFLWDGMNMFYVEDED